MRRPPIALLSLVVSLAGCATVPLYPPRPAGQPGPPIADPVPSKVIIHAAVGEAALKQLVERSIPASGEGHFQLLGIPQTWRWTRTPLDVSFDRGRVVVRAQVAAGLRLLGAPITVPLELVVRAEPVVTPDYVARLQSVEVAVTSRDGRLAIAQGVGGALDYLRDQIAGQLRGLAFDLRPQVDEAYRKIARPIDLPLGDAHGCALLRVTGIEAGPTVFAAGIEKDVGFVIAPSVTLPCTAPAEPPPLPPLSNVATLPSGPFTVTVPIAARYEELAKAMKLAFTDGKLYFSKEFPGLYLSDPEVYAASDQLVLRLRLAGPVHKAGLDLDLGGDIFFAGRPQVVDNELRVPDLQPTIETRSFLLRLKAALDGDSIRQQAREALKLDLGERFAAVRGRLSTELALGTADGGDGCLRAQVAKIEVTGVHPHQGYLRIYVALTAQAAAQMPCPGAAAK